MKRWLVFLAVLCFAGTAHAQSRLTTLNSCVTQDVSGQGSVGIQITSTFVGTVTFTKSVNATDYISMTIYPDGSTTGVSSTTTTGVWTATIAGFNRVKACFTAYTSGAALVAFANAQAKLDGGGTSLGPDIVGNADGVVTGSDIAFTTPGIGTYDTFGLGSGTAVSHDVTQTANLASDFFAGKFVGVRLNLDANAQGSQNGIAEYVWVPATSTHTFTNIRGFYNWVEHRGTGNASSVVGGLFQAAAASPSNSQNTIGTVTGVFARAFGALQTDALVTNAFGVDAGVSASGGGHITNVFGVSSVNSSFMGGNCNTGALPQWRDCLINKAYNFYAEHNNFQDIQTETYAYYVGPQQSNKPGDNRWAFYNADNYVAGSPAPSYIPNLRQGPDVEANTAVAAGHNVLLITETGKLLTNEGATALNVHDLPAAAKGLQFSFCVADTDGLEVIAQTGDTIRIGVSVSAAAGNIQTTTIGNCVTLVAINATEWFATSFVGIWTVN